MSLNWTIEQLKSWIDATFPDNVARSITEADLRDVLNKTVDWVFETNSSTFIEDALANIGDLNNQANQRKAEILNILTEAITARNETVQERILAQQAVANAALGQNPLGEYDPGTNTPALSETPAAEAPAGSYYDITVEGEVAFSGSNFDEDDVLAIGGRLIKKDNASWYYQPPSNLALAKAIDLENKLGGEVKDGEVKLVNGNEVSKSLAPIKQSIIISINAFDKLYDQIELGTITSTGLISTNHDFRVRKVLKPGSYTISGNGQTPTSPTIAKVAFFNSANAVIDYVPSVGATRQVCTFTVPDETAYVYLHLGYINNANNLPLRDNEIVNSAMLNAGTVAKPYEPFGDSRLNPLKIERYNDVLGLVNSELLINTPKKNLIDPEKFDFVRRLAAGGLGFVSNISEIRFFGGFYPVTEGEMYVFTHDGETCAENIGTFFDLNSSNIEGVVKPTWYVPVDGKGRYFIVPIGLGITHVGINLLRSGTSGTVLEGAGEFQLEKGEQFSGYEPVQYITRFNPIYLPETESGSPSSYGELEKLTDFNNLSYGSISKKISVFRAHWIEKDKDLCVVGTGTSLTGGSSNHCTDHPEASERPPLMHSNNFASHIWDKLRWDNQYYRRYDFPGFFTETGSFQTQSNAAEWDDAAYRIGLTRFSNGSAASISFIIPESAWQFNFLFRSDSVSTQVATLSITEGDGQVEVWNDSAWVEANGFSFSQREPAPTTLASITNINPTSGAPQTLTNYQTKGNTTYQRRLKMRCKSGAIDSRAIAKSVTISASSGRLTYWGVEWSKREHMITYINASRGSHSSDINSSALNLAKFQDNEIWSFCPDLLLTEDPIHNVGAGGNLILTRPKAYYARVTNNFFFNHENSVSFVASAARLSLPVPEMIIFNSSISWNFGGIDDNGELIVYDIVDGQWTALDAQMSCYQFVSENFPDIIYINAVLNWVDSARKIYGDLKTATLGSGKSGNTFTNEGSHWNNLGSKIMARAVLPVLNFIT